MTASTQPEPVAELVTSIPEPVAVTDLVARLRSIVGIEGRCDDMTNEWADTIEKAFATLTAERDALEVELVRWKAAHEAMRQQSVDIARQRNAALALAETSRGNALEEAHERHNKLARDFVFQVLVETKTQSELMVVVESMVLAAMIASHRQYGVTTKAASEMVESAVTAALERFTEKDGK